jgi:hypothetical protein
MGRRSSCFACLAAVLSACTPPLQLALVNRTGDEVVVGNAGTALAPGERVEMRYPHPAAADAGELVLGIAGCSYRYAVAGYIWSLPSRIVPSIPTEFAVAPDKRVYLVRNPENDLPGTGEPSLFPISPSIVICD